MKILKSFILILFCSFTFMQCLPPPIDIKLPEAKHKLAIASQILPGGILAVLVSKSFSSLNGDVANSQDTSLIQKFLVSHANVTISENGGKPVQLLELLPGIYTAGTIDLNPGTIYTLNVKDSASRLECSSTSVMQPKVNFDTIRPNIVKNIPDTSVYMDFDFTNIPGSGYYLVYTYYQQKDTIFDLKSLIESRGDSSLLLLDAKTFTNGKYHGHQLLNVSPKALIGVAISNISPEYYKFLSTYVTAAQPINQLTGEPINFPTNITNGYGFFSTNNPSVTLFDLSKW